MIRTRVGYAGGTKSNPTYHSLGDHTETIQIDYNPTKITYEELLDIFWTNHSPTQTAWSRQYMSIVFFHNSQQKRLALETRDREAKQRHTRIFTKIVPFAEFYLAETYHQKYRLQNDSQLMREFRIMYPEVKGFIDSTAAARVNGYLAGNGTLSALEADLAGLGLSREAGERLFDIVSERNQ